uniref:Uncharacterized protein n=1 Tax=Rhizophora mucronata TaxID=61149 RepID=A0A2P2QFW8_RHIMU
MSVFLQTLDLKSSDQGIYEQMQNLCLTPWSCEQNQIQGSMPKLLGSQLNFLGS